MALTALFLLDLNRERFAFGVACPIVCRNCIYGGLLRCDLEAMVVRRRELRYRRVDLYRFCVDHSIAQLSGFTRTQNPAVSRHRCEVDLTGSVYLVHESFILFSLPV